MTAQTETETGCSAEVPGYPGVTCQGPAEHRGPHGYGETRWLTPAQVLDLEEPAEPELEGEDLSGPAVVYVQPGRGDPRAVRGVVTCYGWGLAITELEDPGPDAPRVLVYPWTSVRSVEFA